MLSKLSTSKMPGTATRGDALSARERRLAPANHGLALLALCKAPTFRPTVISDPRYRCVPFDEIYSTVPPKCPGQRRAEIRSPAGNGVVRPQTTDLRLWYFVRRRCFVLLQFQICVTVESWATNAFLSPSIIFGCGRLEKRRGL